MWPGNQFQALFNFQRILCKKDSEVSLMTWTNFDSFANIYLISVACFKSFNFQIEAVFNSLQTEKGLELVFRSQFLQNFLINFFISQYNTNWPNFINRLCLLPRLFSKLHFLRHAQAFDDVTKLSEILKLDFLENEKSFRSETKNIIPSFTSVLF